MFVGNAFFLIQRRWAGTLFQVVDAEHRTPKGVRYSSSFAIYKRNMKGVPLWW